jgi:hypothetical protein
MDPTTTVTAVLPWFYGRAEVRSMSKSAGLAASTPMAEGCESAFNFD